MHGAGCPNGGGGSRGGSVPGGRRRPAPTRRSACYGWDITPDREVPAMRCRSCQTVMMETDVACPTCRAPGPAAHGQGKKKMPGLTAVFPLLGMMVFCAVY